MEEWNSNPHHIQVILPSVAGTREKQVLKHKAVLIEYETFSGVTNAVKDLIAGAVSSEWLEEIDDDILGFQNVTILDMLDHLED